jgi:pimeloyl-ACP methyl ester carboxylesterase
MCIRLVSAALLATALVAAPTATTAAPEIIEVPTRDGVAVRVLAVTPVGPPSATVLLFPGGWGVRHFGTKDGSVRLGTNFLVRTAPLFAEQGLLAAAIDTPSDQPGGMSDDWRTGARHVTDTRKVIETLQARAPGRVVLIGTSRGTLSAAYVAAKLEDPRVTGVVLTSSMVEHGRGRWATVYETPLGKISAPVLIVHHREDDCRATPIGAALSLPRWLKKASRVDFVAVSGGDPAISDPCEPLSAHGFFGRERQVIQVIADWIAGRPIPKEVR